MVITRLTSIERAVTIRAEVEKNFAPYFWSFFYIPSHVQNTGKQFFYSQQLGSRKIPEGFGGGVNLYWNRVYLCNHPCLLVIGPSVSPSVLKYLRYRSLVSLNFCMKLGHHKGTKETELDF